MKKQGIFEPRTTLIFMACCLFHAPANAAIEAAAQEPIEEIDVTGKRSSMQLRMEIERLEEGMFDLFNELNSSDDFDVACHKIKHTGTLIPTWECEPAYLTRARTQNAQDALRICGMSPEELRYCLKDDAELMFENRAKTEQLNAEIRQLALEHPELAKAMLELDAKKRSLVEREQRLREERGLLGLFGKVNEE